MTQSDDHYKKFIGSLLKSLPFAPCSALSAPCSSLVTVASLLLLHSLCYFVALVWLAMSDLGPVTFEWRLWSIAATLLSFAWRVEAGRRQDLVL